MKIKMLMGAVLIAAGAVAQAQPGISSNPTATPRVDQRQVEQERRIQQGVASGQLTPKEAEHLRAEQGRIARAEQKAKSDGKVTPQERARLDRMQDHASRDIAREKHDRQRDMNHDGRKDKAPGAQQAGRPSGERPHGKRRD